LTNAYPGVTNWLYDNTWRNIGLQNSDSDCWIMIQLYISGRSDKSQKTHETFGQSNRNFKMLLVKDRFKFEMYVHPDKINIKISDFRTIIFHLFFIKTITE